MRAKINQGADMPPHDPVVWEPPKGSHTGMCTKEGNERQRALTGTLGYTCEFALIRHHPDYFLYEKLMNMYYHHSSVIWLSYFCLKKQQQKKPQLGICKIRWNVLV